MTATVSSQGTRVRVLCDDELRQRLQDVTEKLSRRFGSLDRALPVRIFTYTPTVMHGPMP